MQVKPNSRAVLCLLCAAVLVALVLIFSGPSAGNAWYQLITNGFFLLLWLLAATGIGLPILSKLSGSIRGSGTVSRPDAESQPLLFLLTSTALGLGIISLLTLALGLLGILNHPLAILLLAAGSLPATWQIFKSRSNLQIWLAQAPGWSWLWLLTMLPLAASVTGAIFPPGLLWGDEPNGYDVIEYHLQVPREWFESGKITPLTENVFSYFPQGVEMHYLLAMHLRGGPWAGMYLAQLMHVALCALAVAAVGAAAPTTPGVLAAIAVSLTPWMTLLAPMAYVEGGVLLYGTLTIGWALRGLGNKSVYPLLITGAMTGFACGAKLTSVSLLLVALVVAADRAAIHRKLPVFFLAALLTLSPWLIRDFFWTGNPVFPEAMGLLGHAHFSPIQVERWARAYIPTTSATGAINNQILLDWRYGYLLVPLALIAAAKEWRSQRARFLVALLFATALFWVVFTHRQSRFFVLAVPICALLIANANWRWTTVGLIVFLLATGSPPLAERLNKYLLLDRLLIAESPVGLLGRENLAGLRGPTNLPPDTRLDLVGDAGPFLYQVPMTHLRYRTVFDVDSSDPNQSIVDDWLNGPSSPQPNRTIVIDPAELSRLSRTYFGLPKLSDEELKALAARPDVYVTSP